MHLGGAEMKTRLLAGVDVVVILALLALGGAFAHPAGAQEPVSELCDGALVANLSDPNQTPVFELPAGHGAAISMDPGQVSVGGNLLINDERGMLIGLYNPTDVITTVVEIKTGWNMPNARWNIHVCVWNSDSNAVFQRAYQWQGESGSAAGEHKPVFRLFVLDVAGPRDMTDANVATTAVAEPTTTSYGEIRLSGHFPVGNWVQVLANEKFWLSSDPGEVCVIDVCMVQAVGYTLLINGPSVVLVKSPRAEVTNYVVGNATDFNWAGTDNKTINLTFREGEFVNR